MGKKYQKKTTRSKRKLQKLDQNNLQVEVANGQAMLQMMLPADDWMIETAGAIEQMACHFGLLVMKGLIDEEVERMAGPRYVHDSDRRAVRWGREEGHVVFAGRKAAIEKPRVRSRQGPEIPLQRYQAFQHPTRLQQAVAERIVRRVSTRDYQGVIEDVCDGYGIEKSSVSRHWKAASAKQLQRVLERPLGDLNLAVLMLDGIEFHETCLIVALGIDFEGRKQVLGLWPGATENQEVCGTLLDELLERGLPQDKMLLFVLDGSKALAKAVKKRFAARGVLQRCRVHKQRNILSHLPPEYHGPVRQRLQAAWGMADYAEAKRQLEKLHDYLSGINLTAARSLEEGLEETLTVHRLKLPEKLRASLCSTNMIESCFSRTRDLCRNVKRWCGPEMVWRWVGTMLLETEKTFRRIRGYKDLPHLLNTLKREVDTAKEVA